MTSRGPVVEAEVDDVTAAVVEPEVDDVTAAALESMSQSCLLSKVVGASPPLLTSGRWLRSLVFTYWLPFRLLQPKLQVTATR